MNKQIVKLVTLMSFSLLPLRSFAYQKFNNDFGPYVGVQLGSTFKNYSSTFDDDLQLEVKRGASIGRVYAGLDFNRYLGLELGVTHYPDLKVTYLDETIRTRMHSIDLLAKGTIPINQKFALYAKGGASYVKLSGDSMAITPFDNPAQSFVQVDKHSFHDHVIRPMAAVGMSYAFNPNFIADISYTKPIDCCSDGFYSLGFTVKFKK